MKPIDFWFFIGSTYTYLTVMRLAAEADRLGARFRWRPFNVRAIMVEQNNRPFVGKPVKTAYMWRDIERRAAMYGLPATVPAPYPLEQSDLANLVATLGAQEGWCADYTRATYARWFDGGEPPGGNPNLEASLKEIGQDPTRVIDAAQSAACRSALDAATEQAKELGIFGSPTFVVDGELFWGDDRLADAVSWHRDGRIVRQ